MSGVREQLEGLLRGSVVIVGVGSRGHGDDEAGPALVERLRGQTRAALVEAGEVPESYLGEIIARGPDTVLLVDAVDFGGEPGEVGLFSREELRGGPALSTHRPPLRLVMDYLEAESKAQVLLLGIQPALVSFGQGLSAPVRRTVDALADLVKGGLGVESAGTRARSPGPAAAEERGL